MFDITHWPDWLQTLRIFLTFALVIGFGIHAYRAHAREYARATSSRRWIYWLYAMAFLGMGVANFSYLLVYRILRSYSQATLYLGLLSLLLMLSYVVASLPAVNPKK